MKEYQVNINGNIISIIQDDDGKFILHDYVKELQKIGTQLKPAYESIIVARKHCDGSCFDNVLKYGVGGINVDECRVPFEDTANPATNPLYRKENGYKIEHGADTDPSSYALKKDKGEMNINNKGRFPANLILTYDDTDFDEVCGGFPISGNGNDGTPYCYAGREYNNKDTSMFNGDKPQAPSNYNDTGSAARYFYCAKASKRDRNDGLGSIVNNHPTVKPTSLMSYLVRLVTSKGETVLDPFMGSGSTGKAVAYENNDRDANYSFIGIELNEEYCKIAQARIEYALDDKTKLDTAKNPTIAKKNKDTNDMNGRLF